MRKLDNTIYVTSEDTYLALDGETLIILREEEKLMQIPLHNIESIVYFGYKGASPALMGECGRRGIRLSFFTPTGRFLCSASGEDRGNVLLRKKQYRISDSEKDSALIAKNFIFGKVYNGRWVLERITRDHPMRVDVEKIKNSAASMSGSLKSILECESLDILRGYEGTAAEQYFSVFDELILQNKDVFKFDNRNRRPPLDPINAMLSYIYAILSHECAAALESVGLDPYVGFLHRDKPGRMSLALDLMEEMRSVIADRFVLTLINNRVVNSKGFEKKENGAVIMNDALRKTILSSWQERKKELITHPFINEKIEWGLIPYVQAQLLARYLRGDIDSYPPFLWK